MAFPSQEHIDAARECGDYWLAKVGVYDWPSVSLAQVVIESGNGKAVSGKNNYGGIKANADEIAAGKFRECLTREVRNGQSVSVLQKFASYDTLKDFYIAHGRIVCTVKRYKAAWTATDPDTFLARIAPIYATEPKYNAIVKGVMVHLDLYRYNKPDPAVVNPPAKPKIPPAAGAGGAVSGGVVATGAAHSMGVPLGVIAAIGIAAAIAGLLWFLSRRKTEEAVKAALAEPPATLAELESYFGHPLDVPSVIEGNAK